MTSKTEDISLCASFHWLYLIILKPYKLSWYSEYANIRFVSMCSLLGFETYTDVGNLTRKPTYCPENENEHADGRYF
jgi:hypothetical protein